MLVNVYKFILYTFVLMCSQVLSNLPTFRTCMLTFVHKCYEMYSHNGSYVHKCTNRSTFLFILIEKRILLLAWYLLLLQYNRKRARGSKIWLYSF